MSNNGGYVINNLDSDYTDYTINNPSIFAKKIDNCAIWNNSLGNFVRYPVPSNLITLSGDPFINSAGANYALNNTAGAGALCRNQNYTYSGGLTTNDKYIGAFSPIPPIGGGGGGLMTNNMNGGLT